MPIALTHGDPDRKKRKGKPSVTPDGRVIHNPEYRNVDSTIDLICEDIAKGMPKREVLKKIQNSGYGRELKQRSSYDYYRAAINRFKTDNDEDAESLRSIYLARWENLYQEALAKKDIYNANNILMSVCRVFGLEKKQPSTQVNIQNNSENIKISFGFNNDDVEEGEIVE